MKYTYWTTGEIVSLLQAVAEHVTAKHLLADNLVLSYTGWREICSVAHEKYHVPHSDFACIQRFLVTRSRWRSGKGIHPDIVCCIEANSLFRRVRELQPYTGRGGARPRPIYAEELDENFPRMVVETVVPEPETNSTGNKKRARDGDVDCDIPDEDSTPPPTKRKIQSIDHLTISSTTPEEMQHVSISHSDSRRNERDVLFNLAAKMERIDSCSSTFMSISQMLRAEIVKEEAAMLEARESLDQARQLVRECTERINVTNLLGNHLYDSNLEE